MTDNLHLHIDPNHILRTLDSLGQALVDHKHTWTSEERFNYDVSIMMLRRAAKQKLEENLEAIKSLVTAGYVTETQAANTVAELMQEQAC